MDFQFAIGTWQHLAVTVSDNASPKLYIDGVVNHNGGWGAVATKPLVDYTILGAYSSGGQTHHQAGGHMDNFFFSDTALSASESAGLRMSRSVRAPLAAPGGASTRGVTLGAGVAAEIHSENVGKLSGVRGLPTIAAP